MHRTLKKAPKKVCQHRECETLTDQFEKREESKKQQQKERKSTQNYLAVKPAFGINILVFVDPHALGCKCNWASHFFRSIYQTKRKWKNCVSLEMKGKTQRPKLVCKLEEQSRLGWLNRALSKSRQRFFLSQTVRNKRFFHLPIDFVWQTPRCACTVRNSNSADRFSP